MKMLMLFFTAIVLFGCSSSEQAARQEIQCPNVTGQEDLSSDFILFSESHGTNESAKLFEAIVCQKLKADKLVLVALEYPDTGMMGLSAFLQSEGIESDVRNLIDSEPSFWRKSQDGRSSKAFLELLNFLRERKQAGQSVDVRPFQPVDFDREALKPQQAAYSLAMGTNLNNLSKIEGPDLVLALVGSFHGKRAISKVGPFSIKSAAMYIEDPSLVSLMFVSAGGSAWNCVGKINADGKFEKDCGVKEMKKSRWAEEFTEPNVIKFGEYRNGFDGLYFVGEATASKPASMEFGE